MNGQRIDAVNPDPVAEIQDATLAVLRRHVKAGETVALVDFPAHQNVGDTMIYAGERAYLKMLGVTVGYVCDQRRFDPRKLRERVPQGPVLLHGGGNLGDMYPLHERFRQRVLAELPDRRILQLPQSVHFSEGSAQARESYEKHPDFTLLLRDRKAMAEAAERFPDTPVEYCPDMAFGLGWLQEHRSAEPVDVVALLRTDAESVRRPVDALARFSHRTVDWGLTGPKALAWRAFLLPGRVALEIPATLRPMYPVLSHCYDAMAGLNLREGRRILGQGRVLLTDRLHAAVLAALLRQPVIAMDNSYGKIGAVYHDYLHRFDSVGYGRSGSEASDLLQALAA